MTTETTSKDWIIDETVNLSVTARESGWHQGTLEEALRQRGLSVRDARDFAAFAFADNAEHLDPGTTASDYLSDEQWERLTLPGLGTR